MRCIPSKTKSFLYSIASLNYLKVYPTINLQTIHLIPQRDSYSMIFLGNFHAIHSSIHILHNAIQSSIHILHNIFPVTILSNLTFTCNFGILAPACTICFHPFGLATNVSHQRRQFNEDLHNFPCNLPGRDSSLHLLQQFHAKLSLGKRSSAVCHLLRGKWRGQCPEKMLHLPHHAFLGKDLLHFLQELQADLDLHQVLHALIVVCLETVLDSTGPVWIPLIEGLIFVDLDTFWIRSLGASGNHHWAAICKDILPQRTIGILLRNADLTWCDGSKDFLIDFQLAIVYTVSEEDREGLELPSQWVNAFFSSLLVTLLHKLVADILVTFAIARKPFNSGK